MAIEVVPTEDFIKELKQLSKKHKTILKDIADLSAQLKINPTMGTKLGQNLYKIRLAISGTNKGKSGGARVITYVVVSNEVVYLAEIYLKSDHSSADTVQIIERLKEGGLF